MSPNPRGRVAIVGAGPTGMAAELSVHQAGHEDETGVRLHPADGGTVDADVLVGADGYLLGRRPAEVDLSDHAAVRNALDAFEGPRRPHTARQVQQAFVLGKVFHHAPAPLRAVRDAILDRTPLLQKVVGDSSPRGIVSQIAAVDEAEARFAAVRGRAA